MLYLYILVLPTQYINTMYIYTYTIFSLSLSLSLSLSINSRLETCSSSQKIKGTCFSYYVITATYLLYYKFKITLCMYNAFCFLLYLCTIIYTIYLTLIKFTKTKQTIYTYIILFSLSPSINLYIIIIPNHLSLCQAQLCPQPQPQPPLVIVAVVGSQLPLTLPS